ncbi:hypothetical protein QL285_042882 [Trifolium repens]|jgi:hypothetical protein|nr:hypothetical protein QL285_042882 [Trifolium repens]
MVKSGTFPKTNETFLSRQFFWLIPPCCLHLPGGEQLAEAATRDVDRFHRVWMKINSWSSKSMSKAGREVLIKLVLQSIPTYFMSIFTIPSPLCDEIEKTMNSLWWGHSGARNKGIHWMSWDKFSLHKNDGRMGFKNLIAFNLALLGKQG